MPRGKPLTLLVILVIALAAVLGVLLSNTTRRPALTTLPTLAVLPALSSTPAPANTPLPSTAVPPTQMPTASPTDAPTTPTSSTPTPSATASFTPPAASSTATIRPSASPTPTITRVDCPNAPELDLHFEEVYSLPIPLREPVRQTLTVQRSALPPCSAWTVSAYRDQDNWAKITLVPTVLVASAWARVEAFTGYLVELVAFKTANGDWQARLMKSADFATLASQIPSSFMDTTGTLPPLAGGYRLPWRDGETWWAITPWHDGNALDFQPTIGASHSVLAAESGFMTELCSDGTQSLLQIRHADGRATYYLHLRLALDVRRTLLDHPVQRGQYLGELINRTAFVTPCGRGYSRHLHFITSDRTLVVDGFPLEQIAETAACCNNPPRYTSSNLRVDAQAP